MSAVTARALAAAACHLVVSALALGVMLVPFNAGAAPKALSTDAEATAYLGGDFRRDFVVEYQVRFRTMPANEAWSVLAITFLAGAPPSDAITIGVFPSGRSPHAYTILSRGGANVFRDSGVTCAPVCRLSLRGSVSGIAAFIGDRELGEWPRFRLRGSAPAIQLNAEVSAPGDRIAVSLVPSRTTAAGRVLAPPACGFTTRGVDVVRHGGELIFGGTYDETARTTYRSLADGRARDACPVQ